MKTAMMMLMMVIMTTSWTFFLVIMVLALMVTYIDDERTWVKMIADNLSMKSFSASSYFFISCPVVLLKA